MFKSLALPYREECSFVTPLQTEASIWAAFEEGISSTLPPEHEVSEQTSSAMRTQYNPKIF
jgi:hypothetical protein